MGFMRVRRVVMSRIVVLVSIALVAIVLAVSCGAGRESQEPEQASQPKPGSLLELIDLQRLPVLADGVESRMFSSVDPNARGNDHGNYLRVDGEEHVMAEMKGPGVISRIWSANPQGRLKIYLDGAAEPILSCPFEDMFQGKVTPFRPPITDTSSGGWYSYWPIAYQRSCKVTVSQDAEITRQRAEDLKPHPINVPLGAAKELKLVVTDGGNGFGKDHADWAEARLVRADGSVVYLSDVTETTQGVRLVSAKQGWGKLGLDVSVEGNPLSIDGTVFKKGLGTHAVGEHVYALTESFDRFEAQAGLDDEVRGKVPFWRGSIAFQVFVDGKKMTDTGVIGYHDMEGELRSEALYYHINYSVYPEGTTVEPFSLELSAEQEEQAAQVVAAWEDTAAFGSTPQDGAEVVKSAVEIPGKGTAQIAVLEGAGRIDRLVVRASSDDVRALRRGILKAYWDGQETPSVWAPLADFFGNGFGDARFTSLYVGMTDEGYYCSLPMPFADGARLEIENGSSKPLTIQAEVTWRTTAQPGADVGRLCTQWRHEIATEGRLYTILDVKGRGKYIGLNLSVQGVADISYLEGNEQFFVDGEEAPSIIGTGTEDFFNGGWYYKTGVFDLPLHGLVIKDKTRTTQYRYQLPDAVGFAESLVAKIEHGTNNIHLDDDYSSIAYFYMAPPTQQAYEPPQAVDMNLPRKLLVRPNRPSEGALGDEKARVIEMRGATFAEDMFDTARSSGEKDLAFWIDISEGYRGTNLPLFAWWPNVRLQRGPKYDRPHRGDVIVCSATETGTVLDLPPVTEALAPGRFVGKVWLVNGPAYGTVRLTVAGKQIAEPVDCYADEVAPGAMIAFGPIEVPQGTKALQLEVVGKNEQSSGYSLGLYAAKLFPVQIESSGWWVIGPFPFDIEEGEASFRKPWPPERETKLDAEYDGLNAKVKWRPMPDAMVKLDDYQLINFDRGMKPKDRATAYAMTYVISPDDREAELRVGSSDPITIGINGARVIDKYVFRRCAPDQEVATVRLRRGTNQLLVKTSDRDREWQVRLRFTDKAGKPMRDLRFSREPAPVQ